MNLRGHVEYVCGWLYEREGERKSVCVRVLGKRMYSFVKKCTHIYIVLVRANCV